MSLENELIKSLIKDENEHDASYDGYVFDYRETRDLEICECGYEHCKPEHSWGPGERRFYLFHLVLGGKGKIIANGVEKEIKKNQIFLQYPGVKYYYQANKNEPWEYVWVGFTGIKVEKLLDKIDINNENFVLKIKDPKKINEYFNGILDTFKGKKVNEAKAMAYLYMIIAFLTEFFPKKDKSKDIFEKQMFVNVLRYIELNYNNVNVSAIAKLFYYDRSSIFRLFNKKLGVSPSVFLEIYRLYCACKFIKTTNRTITQIAYDVGYNNYNWFFTVFKRRLRVSPETFAQLKAEEQDELMTKLKIVEEAKRIFEEYELLENI